MIKKTVSLALIVTGLLLLSSSISLTSSSGTSISNANNSNFNAPYSNVTFTGNISNDFPAGSLIFTNTHVSPWGPDNNISSLYVSYNLTDLFIGVKSVYSGNSLMIFLSNNTSSGQGTYNMSDLNVWSRSISFTNSVNVFFANYADGPSQAYKITSDVANSNTSPLAEPIANSTYYSSGSQEIAIPLNSIFGNLMGHLDLGLSAFIVGGSGSWVGIGAPYSQIGKYNYGNDQGTFLVNNSFNVIIDRTSTISQNPIYLNIVYNDHQPLYSPVGENYWMLPWTDVHLEEYAEQALIISEFKNVNVTYSLSGSLLYQIDAIKDGFYNNSYIKAAFIPEDQWNNSVYYEIVHYADNFLSSFVQRYQWNTTTVREVLENDLAFNSPSWVYSSGTPAGYEYGKLLNLYDSGIELSNNELTNALVEFFLWSVSYPIISGQLGTTLFNSTLFKLYEQTNFSLTDIGKIIRYYPVEAGIVLNQFKKDSNHYGGNTELMTTPFDHPILPLLLQSNWTDQNGANISKGIWNTDVLAQLSLGRGIFQRNFGYFPSGQWTPEQAVSEEIIPYLNISGVKWTSTDQAVLSEAGVLIGSPGSVQYDLSLYQPYKVYYDNTSTFFYFRDSTLSNDWAFNYGTIASQSGNWAAVDDFMNYIRGIYNQVPASSHSNTVVTVALDGENWMFMSPFPEDGVPFLTDLYTALEQNSSWVRTVTGNGYLSGNHTYGVLNGLPTGSWNYQGPSGSVSPYLTQWAGHPTQDATWQQLAIVRNEVLKFGTEHSLSQPLNYSQIFAFNNFPYLYSFNLSTEQGKYDIAWLAIYAAEGSDIYFSFDPGDQNLYSQNDIVFEHEVRQDMREALSVLGLHETSFLETHWQVPLTPSENGINRAQTPSMNGMIQRSYRYGNYVADSISNNANFPGATVYNLKDSQVAAVSYVYNSSYLFIEVNTRGSPIPISSRGLSIYFSNENSGPGDLVGLGVPGAMYSTLSGKLLPFAGERAFQFQSRERGELSTLSSFKAVNSSEWNFSGNDGSGIYNSIIEMAIPLGSIGLTPGNSIEFAISIHNEFRVMGPFKVNLPENLSEFKIISSIYNPAPSNGPGYYTYPELSSDYPAGSVHIEWMNVSVYGNMVRFSFRFKNLSNPFDGPYGFSQPIIDIYIHTSNYSAGSTALLPGVNGVTSPAFAWQWVIQADGFPGNAYIENYTGALFDQLSITSNLSIKTVNVTVPMSLIGEKIMNYAYIIVAGFQDGYATNGWDPVYTSATDYQGGGARSSFAPNVFSYIAPNIVNPKSNESQQSVLSSYTDSNYAVIPGIYLPHTSQSKIVRPTSIPHDVATDYYAGHYHSFFTKGTFIYESISKNGIIWTEPQIVGKAIPYMEGIQALSHGNHHYLIIFNNTAILVLDQSNMKIVRQENITNIKSLSAFIVHDSIYYAISNDISVMIRNSYFVLSGVLPLHTNVISAYYDHGILYLAYAKSRQLEIVSYVLLPRLNFIMQISNSEVTYGSNYSNLTLLVSGMNLYLSYQTTGNNGTSVFIYSYSSGIIKVTRDNTAFDPSIGSRGNDVFMTFVDYQNQWQSLFINNLDFQHHYHLLFNGWLVGTARFPCSGSVFTT